MANHIFTADDIKVVSLDEHVRKNEAMYFGSRGANPEAIATAIAEGALLLGARRVLIEEHDGWWYVCGDVDWLQTPTIDTVNEVTVFKTIWGFPQGGVNWYRSEALARVFSDRAFSASESLIYHVKGTLPNDEQLRVQIASLGAWKRVIGFQFQNSVGTGDGPLQTDVGEVSRQQ